VEVMSKRIITGIIDADTGNEIIYFERKGKPYFYLRDKDTKKFIKRLEKIELRFYSEVEYDREHARKKNPIYADFVALRPVKPEEFPEIGDVEEDLIDALDFWVGSKFGGVVELLEYRGFEYGSKPKNPIEDGYIYFRGIRANTKDQLKKGEVKEYEGETPI
jgi:hypothetical protein